MPSNIIPIDHHIYHNCCTKPSSESIVILTIGLLPEEDLTLKEEVVGRDEVIAEKELV